MHGIDFQKGAWSRTSRAWPRRGRARHAAVGFARHGQVGPAARRHAGRADRTAGQHRAGAGHARGGLADLFALLRGIERRFLVFLDDLGFDTGDADGARRLRSWLEGGVEARPANVRLAVTSNRRAIVERHLSEQDDPINPRDVVDDRLALADRFGLSLGFHNCSQDDFLAIIGGYAAHYGLEWEPADALEWSRRRGGRSGRVAWQYVNELAGRTGRAL
jgi:predicted AAA+ superfamily ATPase